MIQSGYTGPPRSLLDRAVAAARLDSGAFEEVEADTTATGQAAAVVAAAAIAQGIASVHHGSVIGSLIGAFLGWVCWSGVTYLVGTMLFKGTATWGELLRTLGFAQAPGVLYIIRVIPVIGWFATPIIAIWILIAGVIAIRQALDISTGKAVITAFVGWLVLIVPLIVFGGAMSLAFR